MDLFKKIVGRVLNDLEVRRDRNRGHPPRVTIGPETGKRALLMYRSAPLQWAKWDPRFDWHENLRQSRQIAEVMVECGYQTDVVDMVDEQFVPQSTYDLFIGHGLNAARIAKNLGSICRKVCLSTGQYGPYANEQTLRRYRDLELRRGTFIKPELPSTIGEGYYKAFDEIACFGNQYTVDTFAPLNMKVHPFPNYANPQIKTVKSKHKDPCHFVYIAAARHILKGLDLLLEVFVANPEWHLHICGRLPEELKGGFSRELTSKNIHQYGYVKMGGWVFRRICKKAVFYISPSCAEGMQGTALNAMAAGLIPILTIAVGVDLNSCGFRLEDYSILGVQKVVKQCVSRPADELNNISVAAEKTVTLNYRPKNFSEKWREIINKGLVE